MREIEEQRRQVKVELCSECLATLRAAKLEGGPDAVRSRAFRVISSCRRCCRQLPPGLHPKYGYR